MARVRIQKIFWGNTEEHFKKHEVTLKEAENVISSDAYIVEGHSGRKILINRVGKRIIAVAVRMVGNKLYVATARDASEKERKGFYDYEKNKQT